jgi:K+-transporting ATPase KdpF subunit
MNTPLLIMIGMNNKVETSTGYIIGGLIALLIFGYLIYTLIKPEEF